MITSKFPVIFHTTATRCDLKREVDMLGHTRMANTTSVVQEHIVTSIHLNLNILLPSAVLTNGWTTFGLFPVNNSKSPR